MGDAIALILIFIIFLAMGKIFRNMPTKFIEDEKEKD